MQSSGLDTVESASPEDFDFGAFLDEQIGPWDQNNYRNNPPSPHYHDLGYERVDETLPEVQHMDEAVFSQDLKKVRDTFKSEWLDKAECDRIDVQLFISGLNEAVASGNVAIVAYLLEVGVKPRGLLLSAIEIKSLDILELFFKNYFDINKPLSWFEPPPLRYTDFATTNVNVGLRFRCSLVIQDEKLTSWFLSRGADPNAQAEILDVTPLSLAVEYASFNVIKLLFNHGGPESIKYGQPTHHAAQRLASDDLEVMQYILDKDPVLNEVMYQNDTRNSYGFQKDFYGLGTALHDAAERGKFELVKLLLA